MRAIEFGGKSDFLVDQEFATAVLRKRASLHELNETRLLRQNLIRLRRLAGDDILRIDLDDPAG